LGDGGKSENNNLPNGFPKRVHIRFDMLPEGEKVALMNKADEAMKKRAKDQEECEKNCGQLLKDRTAEAATANAAEAVPKQSFHSGAAAQRYANNLGDGGKNETVASKEFEEKTAAKGVQRPTKTTESAKKSAKKAKRKHEEVAGSESDEEDEKKPAAPKEVAAKRRGGS
jgi:hypothetical protein